MKHVTVPEHWSPDEALCVVAFLEQVINAIWRAHGESMADVLNPHRPPEPALRTSCHLDDEIPF